MCFKKLACDAEKYKILIDFFDFKYQNRILDGISNENIHLMIS